MGKTLTKLHDLSLFQHCSPEPHLANGRAFPTVQPLACLRPSRVTLALPPTQSRPAVPPVQVAPEQTCSAEGPSLATTPGGSWTTNKLFPGGPPPSLQSPWLGQARGRPCSPPTRGHHTPFSRCVAHLLARRARLQGKPPYLSALSPICILRRTSLTSHLQRCPQQGSHSHLAPASSGIMPNPQLFWTARCVCICHLSLPQT